MTSSASALGCPSSKAHSIASPGPVMKPSSDIMVCQTVPLTGSSARRGRGHGARKLGREGLLDRGELVAGLAEAG